MVKQREREKSSGKSKTMEGGRNIRGKKNTKREGGGGLLAEFNDPSKSVGGESASKLLTRIKYWRVSCRSARRPRWSALVNPIEYSITAGTGRDTYVVSQL